MSEERNFPPGAPQRPVASRIDSRLQRLFLETDFPGALPQAEMRRAPLALNTHVRAPYSIMLAARSKVFQPEIMDAPVIKQKAATVMNRDG